MNPYFQIYSYSKSSHSSQFYDGSSVKIEGSSPRPIDFLAIFLRLTWFISLLEVIIFLTLLAQSISLLLILNFYNLSVKIEICVLLEPI